MASESGKGVGRVRGQPRAGVIAMWAMTLQTSRTKPCFGRASRFLLPRPSSPSLSVLPLSLSTLSPRGGGAARHDPQRSRFCCPPCPQRRTCNLTRHLVLSCQYFLHSEDCYYPLRWFPKGHTKSTPCLSIVVYTRELTLLDVLSCRPSMAVSTP